jgi:hypothetical protein
MVDTVDVKAIRNAHGRYCVHLTNISDGSGESGVVKVDVSALLNASGAAATKANVWRIEYNIQGFTSVRLHWDAATDDEIAVLPAGSGVLDFTPEGGMTDPLSGTPVGDIKLTTAGTTSGNTYDITLWVRLK